MNNFEDQLDKIRLELYEETKDMAKQDAINHVNNTVNGKKDIIKSLLEKSYNYFN
jgi:hypothetical protein